MDTPTLQITAVLNGMQIGDTAVYPIAMTRSVRVVSSELGLIKNRKYKTTTDRAARTITVTRLK